MSAMTDAEMKALEKEAMGLRARLKWDHVAEHTKDVWRVRLAEIEETLKG